MNEDRSQSIENPTITSLSSVEHSIEKASQTERRRTGSFYTPEWIAQLMIERALRAAFGNSSCRQETETTSDLRATQIPSSWTMLDPSCGDGAFILPVLQSLASRLSVQLHNWQGRLEIVEKHVYGVDSDPVAMASLRERVRQWIDCEPGMSPAIEHILETHFVCGDALLGPSWQRPESTKHRNAIPETAVNWPIAFPHVAASGGFDLIIGNPPYRRERDSQEDFDRIAKSELGRTWRQPRMDLWHYFLHRSLDLLKPDGRIAFIVNSYWTGSASAKPLRKRLQAATTMEEVVLFGSARLFPGVSGRHMIFQSRRGQNEAIRCNVVDLSHVPAADIATRIPAAYENKTEVTQLDLWRDGGAKLRRIEHQSDPVITPLPDTGPRLGDLFHVRQGIAENPPFVTKSIALLVGNRRLVGRGVFVLTDDEFSLLPFNDQERSLLRPYYALSALGRFRIAEKPTHWLLYLTRKTAPQIDDLPNIKAHLEVFRPALERRREVVSGAIGWWHLHWPREEYLFTSPRVICVQMARVPSFTYADRPTFVNFSTHVIVPKTIQRSPDDDTSVSRFDVTSDRTGHKYSLPALAGLLNSTAARHWFETHAKRRGANLDISGLVLKRFPLPNEWNEELHHKLDQLVRSTTMSVESSQIGMSPTEDSANFETEMNRIVDALYWPVLIVQTGTLST